MQTMTRLGTVLAAFALVAACGKKVEEKKDPGQGTGAGTGTAAEPPKPAAAPGVDAAKKVVRIGALNDESGPAKTIGLPFANGKRLLVKAVETGAIKALPE